MVNSIRPNTDRHETPQKHLFVEESCSQDIWIPSSLSILLLNYHSSIAVTCNIPWSPSQKFIYQVEGIQTRGQEGIFGKESKQVPPQRSMQCPELYYFNCRTEESRHAKPVHLGSTVEEPTHGKSELWVHLGSPYCSGPNKLILSSSVWDSTWACTHQGAGATKHKTIFKRNGTNVCICIFSIWEEKRRSTTSFSLTISKKEDRLDGTNFL